MKVANASVRGSNRKSTIIIGVVGAMVMVLFLVQALAAVGNDVQAAELAAEKTVNLAQVPANATSTIEYTIVITNTGDMTADNVSMTDALDSGVSYISGTLDAQAVNGLGSVGEMNNVITWAGSLQDGGYAIITFQAAVTDSLPGGYIITNTAEITGTGSLLTPFAVTAVTSQTNTNIYFPIIFKSPPKLTLQATRPNSSNSWTLSWDEGGNGVIGYELQESQDPNFGSVTPESPGDVGSATSYAMSHSLSPSPIYYYRVRAVAATMVGLWSDTVSVIGGYRDDFDDDTTGWGMRRTTYLEETDAYYGSGNEQGQFVIIVGDRWDWVLASPLVPAPKVPYAIQYEAKVHDRSNLVSGGMVYGGDWNGDACPEYGNIYQTDNCFNHFYNFNYIWYGPLKLLFEQVNYLEWCPNCGGSPLKRIGPTQEIDPIIDYDHSEDWHTYRVEVRSDGARLYIDGSFERHFTDTTWINEPYFGVFASTDEYKPSIWLYKYFQVAPLD